MSAVDASAKTFSESWHLVATVKATLRPNVRAHRQEFRGEPWYVLQDPLNNQFFRVSEDAYTFLCRLTGDCSVDQAWQETLESDPDVMLSQEEIVQLLGQLNMSNLLHFDRSSASASIFDRYKKRRQRETQAKLMGFLAIRIPLLDPDRLLNRALPLIRFLYSPLGFLLYAMLLGLGAKVLMENSDRLFDQSQGLLATGNLMLLYIGFVLAKIVHELGHASACKRFGGEVHVLGVMLLITAPLPYVDASASWGFRDRGKRILVGFAGMLAEFALASVAAMVWAYTAPGPINSVAYNVMFVASVSTIAFNINPLLRFDGYHMLVDLIDIPNLFQRSRDQLRFLAEHYLFGLRSARSVARTREEEFLLPVYGAVSSVYGLMLMGTIVFFIADQYLDLGVLLAFILGFMFAVVPVIKFLYYLGFSPRLTHFRSRAVVVTLLLLGVLLGGLGGIAVPDRVRASGVVEAVNFRQFNSQSEGFLADVIAQPGHKVLAGQPLVRLENADLDLEIKVTEMQRQQLLAQELHAEGYMVADLAPLRQQRAALESTLADARRRRDELLVVAPIAGIWTAPEIENSKGGWIPRGTSLGMIVDDSAFRFVAVLPQVATHVFNDKIKLAEVRLTGEENHNLVTQDVRVIPFENGILPSAALGFAGGGEIAVASDDPSGVTAVEPFFRIYGDFGRDAAASSKMLHGRLGTMRITLGNQPLLTQWERSLRQFLQRKFRV